MWRGRLVVMGLWGRFGPEPILAGESESLCFSQTDLEKSAVEGESPVGEKTRPLWRRYPSSAGHVEPRANLGGPSPKAKYYLATESEPVP